MTKEKSSSVLINPQRRRPKDRSSKPDESLLSGLGDTAPRASSVNDLVEGSNAAKGASPSAASLKDTGGLNDDLSSFSSELVSSKPVSVEARHKVESGQESGLDKTALSNAQVPDESLAETGLVNTNPESTDYLPQETTYSPGEVYQSWTSIGGRIGKRARFSMNTPLGNLLPKLGDVSKLASYRDLISVRLQGLSQDNNPDAKESIRREQFMLRQLLEWLGEEGN